MVNLSKFKARSLMALLSQESSERGGSGKRLDEVSEGKKREKPIKFMLDCKT